RLGRLARWIDRLPAGIDDDALGGRTAGDGDLDGEGGLHGDIEGTIECIAPDTATGLEFGDALDIHGRGERAGAATGNDLDRDALGPNRVHRLQHPADRALDGDASL